MTSSAFLKLVVALWGDYWQQPCLELLARHGHHPTRQTLWNWKKGKTPVPKYVELILSEEAKVRKSACE
jgi:hypothetical protein